MARMYCQQCGLPLPRRAKQCMQCEAIVEQSITCSQKESKGFVEWLAICCAAISCIVFVLTLGITRLFQEGGIAIGVSSFAAIVLSVYWVGKVNAAKGQDDSSSL